MSDTGAAAPWHDPELPFLDVLEQEVRRRASRAARRHEMRLHPGFQGGLQPSSHPSERAAVPAIARRDPSSAHLRIARRALALVTLLCLIGASAYGASEVFSHGRANPLTARRGPFVEVATGRSGSDLWSLRLYARGGELCRVLSLAESESSQCSPPPLADEVRVSSAESPTHRYVFGVTGSRIARVEVTVGRSRKTLLTRAPNVAQAHAAGLPPGARYYLEELPWPRGALDPLALVHAVGARGQMLGKSIPSCLETTESGRC